VLPPIDQQKRSAAPRGHLHSCLSFVSLVAAPQKPPLIVTMSRVLDAAHRITVGLLAATTVGASGYVLTGQRVLLLVEAVLTTALADRAPTLAEPAGSC
jgi:hypothetical protein